MIKGHINIDFITDDMLKSITFPEINVVHLNWNELGIPAPEEPQRCAVVYQAFDTYAPQWAHRVKDMFSGILEHSMVTVNLVKPGNFIPPHKDMFIKLCHYADEHRINLTNKEAVRINVFLQDHKLGHFFEMENNVCMNYTKGDFAVIKQGKIHSVINIGNENRYTLQVSGFADKDTFI
jgi:hypothetical protein